MHHADGTICIRKSGKIQEMHSNFSGHIDPGLPPAVDKRTNIGRLRRPRIHRPLCQRICIPHPYAAGRQGTGQFIESLPSRRIVQESAVRIGEDQLHNAERI